MSGTDANLDTLEDLARQLRTTSADMEAQAAPPPEVEAGAVTSAVNAAVAMLCEGVANVSTGIDYLGDSVAEGHRVYLDTDYQEAARLEAQQAGLDQPR